MTSPRRRFAALALLLAGTVGAAALAARGGPGAPLYVGFSVLVALAGGLLYAGGHRRTAAGFGLVAASALVLGAGRLAVRGSVDPLAVLLVVLAAVAGWRGYRYLRAVRAG